ncbi:MAG: TraR/DksA C4-type zinc finger protein [Candidatus Rokubacteria bacterium]|nr:TraR/DksA C4-type zinc finger protein [Candidatus Rokubacteria bacterium]
MAPLCPAMDVTALRDRLERDRDDTERTLGSIRDRLQHPADAATETESRELDMTQRRMLEARLRRIGDALGRIDRGTYGRCAVCGERIPDERLEALPDTAYCVKDARHEERT